MRDYDFHIVGIGSSAGGIPPLKELVSRLPDNLRAAVIIVPHLYALQRSRLTEILARCAKMPVKRVEESMPVEPGNIYVLAESKVITLMEGCLNIRQRKPEEKINYAIDIFFKSLAKDAGSKAIGVILSGTNADGSEGARAISGNGGMMMAQDPQTAIHPKMPLEVIIKDDPKVIAPLEVLANSIVKKVVESEKTQVF